jgi:hypothetical protein
MCVYNIIRRRREGEGESARPKTKSQARSWVDVKHHPNPLLRFSAVTYMSVRRETMLFLEAKSEPITNTSAVGGEVLEKTIY